MNTPPLTRAPRRRVLRGRVAVLAVTLTLAAAIASPAVAGANRASSNEITRDELGEAQPLNAPGQTLYLQRVTIPPGQKLPEHFHQGTQVARIVKGVLTYDILSGVAEVTRRDGTTESVPGPRTIRLRAGDSLVEVESLAHAGSNAGKRPVVIELAVLLATGAPLATPIGEGAPGTEVALTADLVSQETQLRNAGPNDSVTYGWNRLAATAAAADGPVAVEMLGNVAYTNGAGPLFGFVTFTFADGSVLATQMQGVATRVADTGVTTFTATLGVLNGTGRYLNATGTGTFSGTRDAALGQPVRSDFVLRVEAAT